MQDDEPEDHMVFGKRARQCQAWNRLAKTASVGNTDAGLNGCSKISWSAIEVCGKADADAHMIVTIKGGHVETETKACFKDW